MTTTYDKRDIRTADLLAIVVFGFGMITAGLAFFVTFIPDEWMHKAGVAPRDTKTVVQTWVLAVAYLMLGVVLNIKVRQLVRNGGREPAEYDGVPD